MKLYRYSPIDSPGKLAEAMRHIHAECHRLCRRTFREDLMIAGNIAVFCHYEAEYEYLAQLRREICHEDSPAYGKYYRLREPLAMIANENAPATEYTHLYIRKPDPYRHHVGDVDFRLSTQRYDALKSELFAGKKIAGVRVFDGADMLELHDPESDVLAYVMDEGRIDPALKSQANI
jgi:hypothetical protein